MLFGVIEILSFVVEPRLSIKEGKEDKIMTKKVSVGGKDKEAKKRTTKAAGKEKEVCVGMPVETQVLGTV